MPWNVPTQTRDCGTRASMRSRISPAALLVKVTARIELGRDARSQQVGDASGDHPRLARAGPGQDEQRAVDMGDGLALRGREIGEQVHR